MSLSLTFDEAVDEIMAVVKAVWDPTYNPIHWEEIIKIRGTTDYVTTPGEYSDQTYLKPMIRHGASRQTTMGGVGFRTFTRTGFCICQMFIASGEGLSDGYVTGKLLVDAFEGKRTPGGVWFRDTRLEEIGRDGAFYQFNITTGFTYTEVK